MRERIRQRVEELSPWFHNLALGGVWTAPEHPLGDYPAVKWRRFAHALPADLRGWSVLDIGCNAGFYAMEMKRRGADRVLGIDTDERYLAQARFAAQVERLEIEFRRLSVYEVATLGERFDLVLFLGVLYHLRHPLLALDLIHAHVAGQMVVVQSMQRGSNGVLPLAGDYPFSEIEIFEQPDFPRLHFIEHKYAGDVTNWWIPNRACVEAMLRQTGFEIMSHPEEEVYVCRRRELAGAPDIPRLVYANANGNGLAGGSRADGAPAGVTAADGPAYRGSAPAAKRVRPRK